MTVPSYQDFMLPTLKLIADNCEHKSRDIVEQAADMLGLSEEDKQEKLPSQTQATYYNRAMWARTYLKKACLLDYPARGVIKITQRGIDLLKTNPEKITKNLLLKYDEFREFQNTVNTEQYETNSSELVEEQKTPDDLLEYAQKMLYENLRSELIDKLKSVDPYNFERIVTTVMEKMNYGVGTVTPKSHDDGIDGIIDEDELGLGKIYLQAKRYSDKKVDAKDMKDFIATLGTSSVKKGVFITTSDFIESAKKLAEKSSIQGNVIVLVNGTQLASLMIKHNIGVKPIEPIFIRKKIDEGFFIEGE